MRKPVAVLFAISTLTLTQWPNALAAQSASSWTIILRKGDFIIGSALKHLSGRRRWMAQFDEKSGAFEVALRKQAAKAPAPNCRMDYLILTAPFNYPENPKQASLDQRRAIYDILLGLQALGGAHLCVRLEAPAGIAQAADDRVQLRACNIYFSLPMATPIVQPE